MFDNLTILFIVVGRCVLTAYTISKSMRPVRGERFIKPFLAPTRKKGTLQIGVIALHLTVIALSITLLKLCH